MSQKKPVAKNNLSNLRVTHVHLVGTPAVPDSQVLVEKSINEAVKNAGAGFVPVHKEVTFKADNPVKKQVYLYCLVPDKPDLQGDVVSKEDVADAAHSLMEAMAVRAHDGEGSGVNHQVYTGVRPIESAVDVGGAIAKAYGKEGIDGAWWIGFQLDDATWTQYQKGELTGASIGGAGKRTPIEPEPEEDTSVVGKILKAVGEFITRDKLARVGKIDTDAGAVTYQQAQLLEGMQELLSNKFWAMRDSVWSIIKDPAVTDKSALITQTVNQFTADLLATIGQLSAISAAKSTKSDKGDDDMTTDQVNKFMEMIGDLTTSVKGLAAKLDAEPAAGDPPVKKDEGNAGDPPKADPKPEDVLTKAFADLRTEVQSLAQRVEKWEKTPRGRRGTEEAAPVTKAEGDDPGSANFMKGTALDFRAPEAAS